MRILYVSFLHPAIDSGGVPQQVAYEMFEALGTKVTKRSFLAAIDPHDSV